MNAPASQLDRIEVPDLRVACRIGVAPGESDHPQTLRLSLHIHLDLRRAGRSDRLSDSVDYADLIDRIEALVQSRTWALLEGLGQAVSELVLCDARVEGITLRVEKVRPPWDPSRGPVAIRLQRHREASHS